jgi:hypothetical protein
MWLEKFPVHPVDIADGNLLGACSFAFSFIGTVAETKVRPVFEPRPAPAEPLPVFPGAGRKTGISSGL